jgi:dTDP-4-dehydrorhamnose reductase
VKVLVLGASGMIGHAIFRAFMRTPDIQIWGTVRRLSDKLHFNQQESAKLLVGGDLERRVTVPRFFTSVKPDVVINCVGMTKHHQASSDPQISIPINALFPHQLSDQCSAIGARLIHISTDCVFSGLKGNYCELDEPDARDIYGKTKHLGELKYTNSLTLRTSTIGHELSSAYGLLEWFLAQQEQCSGFARALFSGLTNIEFSKVVKDIVIQHQDLQGLLHVGGPKINKFELLLLIAKIYGKKIKIIRNEEFILDRSLNSSKFESATGYQAPSWSDMISIMYAENKNQNV